MKRPTLSALRLLHAARFHRRNLGCSPTTGRPIYGWSCGCVCGWNVKTNEDKAYVQRLWREHTRDLWDDLK